MMFWNPELRWDWNKIDTFLENQEMPPEYKNVIANIFCNDCKKKSYSNYHFIYNKCSICNGYNTNILNTTDYISILKFIIKIQNKYKQK